MRQSVLALFTISSPSHNIFMKGKSDFDIISSTDVEE